MFMQHQLGVKIHSWEI